MRKIILIVSAVFVLCFGALQFLVWQIRPTDRDTLRKLAATMPDLTLTSWRAKSVQLSEGRPTVLVYFNSTCDHCQRQIKATLRDIELFEGMRVVFMSTESIEVLAEVESKYGVTKPDGFELVHCDQAQVAERFGALGLPQIFVYDANGKLVELFTGETPPAAIVRTLK